MLGQNILNWQPLPTITPKPVTELVKIFGLLVVTVTVEPLPRNTWVVLVNGYGWTPALPIWIKSFCSNNTAVGADGKAITSGSYANSAFLHANAAFAFANTNGNCALDLFSCNGDISGTSSYFDFTGGGVNVQDCFLFNNIESTTQSVFTGASIDVESSTVQDLRDEYKKLCNS